MSERLQCEFSLVRYVPDVAKGEFTNIGVVLRPAGAGEMATVRFTRDWSRVRCLDASADVELLEALEAEMTARLQEVASDDGRKPLLNMLEDSLSNSVQMTEMRATLAESLPAEMELLLRLYVEPLKPPGLRRKATGRTAIAARMRTEFDRAGVWPLMRKRIAAAMYTQPGDPLKIDCGYRTITSHSPALSRVRMFHAVSLENDVEAAKGIAYSAPALREGVARMEGAELELTAVVESLASVADAEQYRFGVQTMEREQIRVLTVADLGRAAETAGRELKV